MATEMSNDELTAFTASANLDELKTAYVRNHQLITDFHAEAGPVFNQTASIKQVKELAAAYGVQALDDVSDLVDEVDGLLEERRKRLEERRERIVAAMEAQEKGSVKQFQIAQAAKLPGIYELPKRRDEWEALFSSAPLEELQAAFLEARRPVVSIEAEIKEVEEQWETMSADRKKDLLGNWGIFPSEEKLPACLGDYGKNQVLGMMSWELDNCLGISALDDSELSGIVAAMEKREKGSVEKFRKEQGIYDEKKWY